MVPQNAGHEVGEVFDVAVTLFKAAFVSVLVLSVASALVRSIPYAYPGLAQVVHASGVLTNTIAEPVRLLGALGELAIAFSVTWPVGMLIGLGVIIQLDSVARGTPLGWREALARGWNRVLPLCGCLAAYAATFVLILGGALITGSAIILWLPLDASGYLLGLVAGLIGMGVSLVAAVPLLALFVYWCLALPLVAVGNLDAVGALRKSWRLVRGHWRRTLAIVSAAGFVVFAVASLAGAAGMMLIAVTEGGPGVRMTVFLLHAAGASVTTPLFLAALLATLRDLDPDSS